MRPEPVEPEFTRADDHIRLEHWLPPQRGVAPRLRIGKRWINLLWLIPLGVVGMVASVWVARWARGLPVIEHFIARWPGAGTEPIAYSGFPAWMGWQHFFNFFFLFFIMRAGVQILADHPRLYWNRHCTPGTEWFRFQKDVPKDRLWTAKDDSVTLPGWLGLPGVRHSIGLARWWHFGADLLWLVNGVVFYVLLFATSQWERIVPRSWDVFPNALSTTIQYLSLRFPADDGWIRFNGLQLLVYFATVFIAAPLAILTGLMQSPAISNKLGALGKVLNRQVARSIHFLVLCWFLFFLVTHVTMVFVTGWARNLNHMFAANDGTSLLGFGVFCAAMAVVVVTWLWASPLTVKHSRWVQKTGRFMFGWIKGFGEYWDPSKQYTEKDISPYFWPNGTLPMGPAFDALVAGNFSQYRLKISGRVEHPCELSLAELRAMPKQEQITEHFCIQGWSGVAKWGGVPMRHLLEKVQPTKEARWVVFWSLADGADGGPYYDVHSLENMRHHLTILAYEMNGETVSVLHGAPLRLRCENELGFKMVKWISAIEFVDDFAHLGAGQGGYNEDHEFYGYRMPI